MRLRRAALGLAGLLATAALARPVFAQGPMMFGGPGRFNSPLMSNTLGLLMTHIEVQTELRLDLRQKNALSELQNQSQADMRQRMQQVFQDQRQNFQDLRNLPADQRRQRMQEIQQQIQPQVQAAMNAYQGEIDERVKKILTPAQVTRLHQLDLQKRGILSLGDPKVADEIKIASETRSEISKTVTEWQQQQGEIIRAAMQTWFQNGGPQSGQQPPDFQNRLSPIRQKLDANQKAAEDKVWNLLTPEEQARWKAALGASFTFRPDPPMNNNFMNRGGFGRGGRGGRGGAGGGGG